MTDDSEKIFKLFATAITTILMVITFFILKTDPIRDEGPARKKAIEQVITFAAFVENRPEIAKPAERTVIEMAKSSYQDFQQEENFKKLDLWGEQLIAARMSSDDVVRFRADEEFEKYLKLETRENRKQQMISIFNEKVIQKMNQQPNEVKPLTH